MKLNNRGVTLIELIISVVLVTIIMGFMYKLILDVNNMQSNDTFASKNQLKRNEIIKAIENDLIDLNITNVEATTASNSRIVIRLYYDTTLDDNYLNILTNGAYLAYSIKENGSQVYANKWLMEDCTINFKKVSMTKSIYNDIYTLLFDFEVYTDNTANDNCEDCTNNIADDIIISYTGKIDDNNRANIYNLPECFGVDC